MATDDERAAFKRAEYERIKPAFLSGPPSLDVGVIADIFAGSIGDRLYFFGAAYGHPKDESYDKIAADFVAELLPVRPRKRGIR